MDSNHNLPALFAPVKKPLGASVHLYTIAKSESFEPLRYQVNYSWTLWVELDSNEQYSFKRVSVLLTLLSVTIPAINRHSVYIAIHPVEAGKGIEPLHTEVLGL